jgi:tol-pal system protein YbgF
VAAAALVTGLAGGCSLGQGAKAGDETKAPPDSPAALRQDVDRLRADLAGLRTHMETVQRAGTEHADRVAQETRAEFDAVQKAMEASSRHDLQRQVEVLDAQARRIDLLERRANELGQALRRAELGLSGLESQLSRVLDGASALPSTGARGGSPGRSGAASPGPRAAVEPAPAAPMAEGAMSTAGAGAGLTPPAMLGPTQTPRSSPPGPAGPARETAARQAKVDSAERPPAGDAVPAAKRTEASREAKVTPPTRPAQDDAARVAKAAPPATETRAATPGRSAGSTPPRSAKTGKSQATPAAGALTAHTLFERGMESWNKGEQGQAVLEFEELVQTFPSDPLAATAQFRIGEAYYTARDFERAALEYRKAVELAPKGKDTPRALLRLGQAYRAQKRETDARQAWSQLVRDFPESEATEEARRALRGR